MQRIRETHYPQDVLPWRLREPRDREYKRSIRPAHHPLKLPNALALLTLLQLERLDAFKAHRLEIARFYSAHLHGYELPDFNEQNMFLMYTIRSEKALDIMEKAKQEGILLGVWRGGVIVPPDCNLERAGYRVGSCPKAEKFSDQALNLPTHVNVSLKDAKRIVDLLNVS